MIDAASEPFDIFLLDVMMPGTCGIELCREIRAYEVYNATPIIMITASRAHDVMSHAFAAGATDFVSKPFDGLELGTRINLAALLSESLRRERMSQHKIEELNAAAQIVFDERFELRDVPGATSFLTLENDLLRRDEAVYAMTLVGVQITGARRIYESGTAIVFRTVVEAASAALSQAIDTTTTRYAYVGRGCFVAVVYSRERVNPGAIAEQAQAALMQSWDAQALNDTAPPALLADKIEDKRFWTGRTAAGALRSFQGRADVMDRVEFARISGL